MATLSDRNLMPLVT